MTNEQTQSQDEIPHPVLEHKILHDQAPNAVIEHSFPPKVIIPFDNNEILKTLGITPYKLSGLDGQLNNTNFFTDYIKKPHLSEIVMEGRDGNALVSVCTMSHLQFALTMIASVREHHATDELSIFLLLVDWDSQNPLDLELSDVNVFAGQDIGINDFDYMALKYSPAELSSSCKSYFIHYVMTVSKFKKILYLDADIYVFARLDIILNCLDEAHLVVTPHTLAPLPNRDVNQRPSLEDIINAGLYNAGMFGLVVNQHNAQLVSLWAELVSSPGAFVVELGSIQFEQKTFNWLASLSENLKVLKDTTYNVAYWNLHDRSLRYEAWDNPARQDEWKVDGKPLVAFHFSGFRLNEPNRLSIHDSRYHLYFLPSVTKLIQFYISKLSAQKAWGTYEKEYRFNQFISGLKITPKIRQIFKKYENTIKREINPWSESGESYYAKSLFLPQSPTPSLLPIALYTIYMQRIDLQKAFPKAHIDPEPMINWFSLYGMDEDPILYEYFNCYRPTVPILQDLESLISLKKKHADLFNNLAQPFSKNRATLIQRLKDGGFESDAHKTMAVLGYEYYFLSPIYLLWKFVNRNPNLMIMFPDILFADAPAFAQWLIENGQSYFLEATLADIFLQKAQGHSLARIFSFLNNNIELSTKHPLSLIGEENELVALAFLKQSQFDQEYRLDDVAMYLWIMSLKPWAGLPLTLELLINARQHPSPLLPEGQDILLKPVLMKPGFQEALALYRSHNKDKKLDLINIRRYQQPATSIMYGKPSINSVQQKKGVNFFGFFKSPIGLGNLSKGLSMAFHSTNIHVQENILTSASMNQDLLPEDLICNYDYALDTNLFVSTPHRLENLLKIYPDNVTLNRKNIIYLAWEQRDGYPSWDKDFESFDQVWALSDFAATSFRRYMKRDIVTIPAVLDFRSFPQQASKEEMELDSDKFIFLYVFDVSSSIERKNPEAVINAFIKAFSPNDKVQLLLKIKSAHRLDYRYKLRKLANMASRSALDIQFFTKELVYTQVLKLISAVDCYVSLHRSEGFGYTSAEAMSYAKPVIATNYSATTEFMDNKTAYLVDYKECEVAVADGPFQRGSVWAEPNVEHASFQMRQVYLNQQAAKITGLAGQSKVRELFSPERIGKLAHEALFNIKVS